MPDVFEEINEYVIQNGTGVNKGGDIYNKTVYFRIFEFLYNEKIKKAILNIKRIKELDYYNIGSLDDLYYDCIIIAVDNYNPEAGMTFVSYFVQRIIWKIFDEGKGHIKESDAEMMLYDKDMDDALTKIMDQNEIDTQGYEENDSGLLREEQFESICDLLYDISQVVQKQKRTKAEIFRLFYTDTIMCAFSEYSVKRDQEFRHEKQIFENMEIELVDYIFVNAIKHIRDMAYEKRKTVTELMKYFSDLKENKKEVEEKYLSVWGKKEKDHPEYEVKLPLSNAVFLAYIFIKEYEQTNRREIPEPHKPGYISNYSGQYKEFIASFFTPEIKAMYN